MSKIKILEKFEKLLQKMKLRSAVPQEIRTYSIKKKRKVAVIVLKRFAQYSLLYGLVTRVFYSMNSRGFTLSVKQAKVISSFLISLMLFGIATGVYSAVRYINLPDWIERKENVDDLKKENTKLNQEHPKMNDKKKSYSVKKRNRNSNRLSNKTHDPNKRNNIINSKGTIAKKTERAIEKKQEKSMKKKNEQERKKMESELDSVPTL